VSVKGITRSAVYPVQWVKLLIMYCGMAVKRMEMLGVSVRNIKALTEGRDNDTDW
jgi:hypothetical protein